MAKKYLIALDDGYGMSTAGKRTPPLRSDLYIDGKLVRKKGEVIKENEFNRAVVAYLEKALKRCGFDVLLVAQTDADTSLATRVSCANVANADAYISKHYNALGSTWQSKAKGLVIIIHNSSQAKTKVLAKNVHEELWKLHKDHNCTNYGVRTDTDISGFSLYVLRNTNMPAILTESGFMDSVVEYKDMLDPTFQKNDAEVTCKGICKTFGVTYVKPDGTDDNDDDFVCTEKDVEVSNSAKYVKVIVNELNVRSCPSWEDGAIVDTVKKGEVFTITKKVKVGSGYMYKLKSGLYITASTAYVKGMTSL